MLNSLVAPSPRLFWRAGFPRIGDPNRRGRSLSPGELKGYSMINAVSATRKEHVGRKTAYATCMRTRAILLRNRGIDLNELFPGESGLYFYQGYPLDARQLTPAYLAHGAQDSLHHAYSRALKRQLFMSSRRGRLPQKSCKQHGHVV